VGRLRQTLLVPIYEMTQHRLEAVPQTTYAAAQVRERDDLQRLLRDQIDVVSPSVLLIGEEFEDFVGTRRRIDLLGIDTSGRLVVIELKRTDDGGHAELQAIRYAAMVSAMTLNQIVEQRERFAADRGLDEVDSRSVVLAWIGGEEMLGDDVRIVLVAADFGLELTTTVLWLTERHNLDITCVRAVPYRLNDRLLLNVEQVIPLPETASYQVSVRRKEAETRQAAAVSGRDFTKYQLLVGGLAQPEDSKQGCVKQAVALLVERGVPLVEVREAVGNRWSSVSATSAEEVSSGGFAASVGMSEQWWFDNPYPDVEAGVWWVMRRVGGRETEQVLSRLSALRPEILSWRKAVADDEPV
jgi:hypothetical protein